MDSFLERIVSILTAILKDGGHRQELVSEFQQLIWDTESIDERYELVLRDLSYDLDFYETHEKRRQSDGSLFGDTRLEKEVAEALQKIQTIRNGSVR